MVVDEVTRTSLADALALGSQAWDDVMQRTGCASPFMSWAWHRAWADAAPSAERAASEVLMLQDSSGSLEAVLPLRRCHMRFRRFGVQALTWAIGDTGCPDELDVPSLPDTDLQALTQAIEDLSWQIIVLPNLVDDAPNRRQILRRKERALRRDHAVTLVDYDQNTLDEGWSHLVALHEQRWNGAGGAFRDPRTAQLQRQFAGEMARQQRLWLTTLNIDGRAAAAWYGFTSDDTVYFYQGGRDPQWQRESVGLVLMSVMIQRAIERGYRVFNFLRGDDEYKNAWKPSQRMTRELVVFRSGWTGRGLRLLDMVAAFRGSAAR